MKSPVLRVARAHTTNRKSDFCWICLFVLTRNICFSINLKPDSNILLRRLNRIYLLPDRKFIDCAQHALLDLRHPCGHCGLDRGYGSRECFHEQLHRDDKMTVTFQVGDREFGGSGNLEIDFWVRQHRSPGLRAEL
jgi:hypothetical protein